MKLRWRRGDRGSSKRDAIVAELRATQATDEHGRLLGARKSAHRAALAGADLQGVDLRFAWASVRNASWDGSTRWPAGFSPQRPSHAGPLLH